jgi:nucleoside 2-deoxyribosyltransferase
MMKVYFSCSLTGGRGDEAMYGAIVDWLLAEGHEVLTAHLARPGVLEAEQTMGAREVYARDMAWVEAAEALIAEVSTPSHGVGYEIAFALMQRKPTLCLYQEGVRVSKMILGNSQPSLTLAAYADERAGLESVERFMAGAGGKKRPGQ